MFLRGSTFGSRTVPYSWRRFPPKGGVGVFRFQVQPTGLLKANDLGDFKMIKVGRRRRKNIVIEARVSSGIARGKIKTFGDLTFSQATLGRRSAAIYIGPRRQRAAAKVWIGQT